MEFLRNHIEALIFCASKPITLAEIKNCLSEMFDAEVAEEDIQQAITDLVSKYENDEFGKSSKLCKNDKNHEKLNKSLNL